MADRKVEITVLALFRGFIANTHPLSNADSLITAKDEGSQVISYYYPVKNFDLQPYKKALLENGIAATFKLPINDGDDILYTHLRFTEDGELKEWRYKRSEINPNLHELMTLVNGMGTPGTKLAKLEAKLKQHQAKVTPLPWNLQDDYGKNYIARQFLLGDTNAESSGS